MSSVIVIVSYGLGWPSEINNIVKAAIPFYVSDMCGTFVLNVSIFSFFTIFKVLQDHRFWKLFWFFLLEKLLFAMNYLFLPKFWPDHDISPSEDSIKGFL